MKALVLTELGKVVYQEYPDPVLTVEHNVLVRVKAVGICGSDVQGFLGRTGRRVPPMIMGHEMSGEVVAILSGTASPYGLAVGDSVVILPFVNCRECGPCCEGRTNFCQRPLEYYGILQDNGGMCDYISIASRQLVKIPKEIDYRYAALAEPLAVAYSGTKKVCGDSLSPVLLLGAGTIGLLALGSLQSLGFRNIVVCDANPRRLELARKMGAGVVVAPELLQDASWIATVTKGNGFKAVLDAVGVPATYSAGIKVAAIGATLVWIGNACKSYEISIPDLVMRELTVKGSFIYSESEIKEAICMIVENRIDLTDFIELVLPMERGAEAFERLANNKEDIVKAILVND